MPFYDTEKHWTFTFKWFYELLVRRMKDITAGRCYSVGHTSVRMRHGSNIEVRTRWRLLSDGIQLVFISLTPPFPQRLQMAPCQESHSSFTVWHHHSHVLCCPPVFVFVSIVLFSLSSDWSTYKLIVLTVSCLLQYGNHLNIHDYIFEINELLDVNTSSMAAF